MTKMHKILVSATLLILATASPAFSKTPDGKTPAEEDVCDPLRDATPGLYGLCVAYCEAHDAELLSLYGDPDGLTIPNQRILKNYNKKKKESDPAMPCVLQEGPLGECPCWTAEQLEEMMPPTSNFDTNYPNACSTSYSFILENFENGYQELGYQLQVVPLEGCGVIKYGNYNGGPQVGFTSFRTTEEEESCKTLLSDHAKVYQSDGVWDCFE